MLLLFVALSPRPLAATEGIGIELNRLEEQGSNCRAYLVITNPGELAFSGFKVSQVVSSRRGLMIEGVATLRGEGIRYRAVLLPLSENGATIDHVLGAMNYRLLRTNEALSTQVNFRRLPVPRNARDF